MRCVSCECSRRVCAPFCGAQSSLRKRASCRQSTLQHNHRSRRRLQETNRLRGTPRCTARAAMEVEFESLDWLEDEGGAEQTSATAVRAGGLGSPPDAQRICVSHGRRAPAPAAATRLAAVAVSVAPPAAPAAGGAEVRHEARQHHVADRRTRKHARQERVRRGETPIAALWKAGHSVARAVAGVLQRDLVPRPGGAALTPSVAETESSALRPPLPPVQCHFDSMVHLAEEIIKSKIFTDDQARVGVALLGTVSRTRRWHAHAQA